MSAKEQQLLVRTVQQEVEIRALRNRIKLLEEQSKESRRSPERSGEGGENSAAGGGGGGKNADESSSSSSGNNNNNNNKKKKGYTTPLMKEPVVAEEILPDPDALQRQPTHHHSAVVLGSSIFVYGGQHQPDPRGNSTMESDMWAFNLEKRAWRRIEVAAGTNIRGRSRHSAASYKGSMFIYGGHLLKHGSLSISNTMHTFSPASGRWFDVPLNPAGEELADHTAVVVKDTMFIFGGINSGGRNNIVRGIDLAQRSWLDAHKLNPQIGRMMQHDSSSSSSSSPGGGGGMVADVPAPRSGHSAVTWHNVHYSAYGATVTPSMVVFGGQLTQDVCANDCFIYNYQTNMWSRLFCGGRVPEPRSDHTASCVKEWMFVCGGIGAAESGEFNLGDDDEDEDESNNNNKKKKKKKKIKSKKQKKNKNSGDEENSDQSSGNDDDDDEDSDGDESDNEDGEDESSGKKDKKNKKKKKKKKQHKKKSPSDNDNSPKLFNDVYALNLQTSVWQKIEITTIRPTILSQCGHASIIYQSHEGYIAMLTFGGVSLSDPNLAVTVALQKQTPEHEADVVEHLLQQHRLKQQEQSKQLLDVKLKKKHHHHHHHHHGGGGESGSHSSTASSESDEEEEEEEEEEDEDYDEDDLSSHSDSSDGFEDENKLERKLRHRRERRKKLKKLQRRKEEEEKHKISEHVVDGSIFVMRLIGSSSGGRGNSPNRIGKHAVNEFSGEAAAAAADQQQATAAAAGGGGGGGEGGGSSRPGSATSRGAARPGSATGYYQRHHQHHHHHSSSSRRPGSATSRPGSAMSRGSGGGDGHRWVTTGSHVEDRPQMEARLRQQTPRPPSTKRTDEEINRFFRSLIERSTAQVEKAEIDRMRYYEGLEKPAAQFESSEDEQASVSRLYFEAIRHSEEVKHDLEERFSPRNPSKQVEDAVIGDTVERLFGLAARSPEEKVARAREKLEKRPLSPDQKKAKPIKKVKRFFTPEQVKDQVQRLHDLSVKFQQRRQKELADKHLYHGLKPSKKVNEQELVTRLYKIPVRPESPP